MRVNNTQTIGDLPCIHELPVFREPVWAVESSRNATTNVDEPDWQGEARADARHILSYNGARPRSPGANDSKWIHTFTLSAIARAAVDPAANEDPDDSPIGTPVEPPNEENIELEIHPVDELVTIRNVSNSDTVLTGYHLNFEAGEDSQVDRIRQLAGELILRTGEEVTVATGAGEEGEIPLKEPYDGEVLNNEDPDRVALLDEDKNFVAASEKHAVEFQKDPDHLIGTSSSVGRDHNKPSSKDQNSSHSVQSVNCDKVEIGEFWKDQITLDVDSDHVEIWTEVVEDYERFFTLEHLLDLDDEDRPSCPIDKIEGSAEGIITGLFEDDSDSSEDDFKDYLNEFYNDDDVSLEEIKEQNPEGVDYAAFTFAKGGAAMLAPRLHPAVGAGATALSVGKLLWETWEAYQGSDGSSDTDVAFSSKRDVRASTVEGHQITFHLLVDPVEQGDESVPLTFKSDFGKVRTFVDGPPNTENRWELVTEVDLSRKPYPDWSENAKMNWPRYYRENYAIPEAYDQELTEVASDEPNISINVPNEVTFGERFDISASITSSDQIDPELYVWGIYDEDGPVAEEDCGLVTDSGVIPNPDFQAAAQGFCNDASLGTTTVDLFIFDQSGVTWHQSTEFEVTPGPGPSAEIEGPTSVEAGKEATWNAYGSEGEDLSYTWSGDVSGSDPEVTETFNSEGNRTIKLEVKDQYGQIDSTTHSFDVIERTGPSATIDGPKSVELNEEATWDAHDSEGEDLSYTWSGDVSSSGPEVVETFESGGIRTIRLDIIDKHGQTDDDWITVAVKPLAEISGPTSVEIGEEATWDAHDSEGADLSYTWRETAVTDEYLGSGPEITEAFESPPGGEPGGRTIELEIEDEYGQTNTDTLSVILGSSEPVAEIDGPTLVSPGEKATWDAHNSEGEDLSYTWSGDVTGSGPEVTETFSSEGDRTIELEVKDEYGRTDSTSQEVSLLPPPPSAVISGPTSVDPGEEATWDAHDSEGEDLNYSWRETIFDEHLGSGPEITEAFESPPGGEPGGRTIKLEVEDEYGQTDSTTQEISLLPPQPSAVISGPTSVDPGEKATWDASNSEGDDLSYTWSGDVTGSGPEVTETFSSEGDRTIELEVKDEYGRTDSTTREISVTPPQPSAVISGPTSVDPGEKATWDAHDSEGEDLSYTWWETAVADDHLGSGPEITEAFESPPGGEPGGRTIKLEVEDEYGQTDSTTQSISVTPPLPSAEISGPTSVDPGEEATWDAHDSEGEDLSYTWRETAVVDDYLGSGPEITEAFESLPGGGPGGRTIELEVEDQYRRTDTETLSVLVDAFGGADK